MQAYSDPARENDPHALPDLEIWEVPKGDSRTAPLTLLPATAEKLGIEELPAVEPGWYYWFCFPGCLPDGEKFGPFTSKEEALEEAQQ